MRNSDSATRLARTIIDRTTVDLTEQGCSYRDDPGHDHEQCLEQYAVEVQRTTTQTVEVQ